ILDSDSQSLDVGRSMLNVRYSDSTSTSNIQHRTSSIESGSVPPRAWICRDDLDRRLDRYQALAERLLIGDRAADVQPIAAREPVSSLLSQASNRLQSLGIDPMQADVDAHYRWIESVASSCSTGFQ